MKISFIEPHLKIFGGIRRIVEISNRLTERGHDVTIFHSDGTPCEWMKCIAKTKPARDVLKESHDVLIYNDPVPLDFRLVKKARANIKVFFVLELYRKELLNQFTLKYLLPKNWRTYYVRKSLLQSYLILCNASWERNWLKENLDIDSELMIGGMNTELFHPIEMSSKNNSFHILHSGDPRTRKGTDLIDKALDIVKDHCPAITVETYHGKGIPQEQMAATYCGADLFLEASLHAGWNNPVAEAMACKVPVVCTAIGGVEDFAINEETALLVPTGNPQAMAKAILRMINTPQLRQQLRENAYKKITQFKWDDCIDNLETVLSNALQQTSFNPSYIGERHDVLKHIPATAQTILDVGCSVGSLGESIKKQSPQASVKGIEAHAEMAEMARSKLNEVIVADVETINPSDHFNKNEFDCIIFADLLEHLRDPWKALREFSQVLDENGTIVLSLPNVRHYSTIVSLLFLGRWPYRNRGIHDKTHLRFFTLKNIKEMLNQAGLEIIQINYRFRLLESVGLGPFNRIAWIFNIPVIRSFFVFQYLITAKKTRSQPA